MSETPTHWSTCSTTEAEALRAAVEGLAAGLWRREGDELVLVAFSATPAMPADVQAGFREATARVSLEQTELAIVRAVVSRKIAFADPPQAGEEGSGSPAWLKRFAARRSLALPLERKGVTIGAIAVAFTRIVDVDSPERVRLEEFAERWSSAE